MPEITDTNQTALPSADALPSAPESAPTAPMADPTPPLKSGRRAVRSNSSRKVSAPKNSMLSLVDQRKALRELERRLVRSEKRETSLMRMLSNIARTISMKTDLTRHLLAMGPGKRRVSRRKKSGANGKAA